MPGGVLGRGREQWLRPATIAAAGVARLLAPALLPQSAKVGSTTASISSANPEEADRSCNVSSNRANWS
jgi:hypothetical protein